jgi:hypothetical protein
MSNAALPTSRARSELIVWIPTFNGTVYLLKRHGLVRVIRYCFVNENDIIGSRSLELFFGVV